MIKGISRKIIYPLMYQLGIAGNLLKKENRSYVLCYHGVMPKAGFTLNNRHIDARQFEKDLKFFNKHFEVVSLEEIFRDNTSSKPRVALTFDDGYLNNFEHLIPIIDKYKVPVTLFVISASLERENFITWYDLVDFIKQVKLGEINFYGKKFIRTESGSYTCEDKTIEQHIKSMRYEREAALVQLEKDYSVLVQEVKSKYPSYWKLVDKDVLSNHVKNPNVRIGSHTHLHYNLEFLDEEQLKDELKGSKDILESFCDYEVNSIAFPDGSYNEFVKKVSFETGYAFQLAVEYKLPNDLYDKSLRNRYSVSNSTTHEANMLKLALYRKQYGHL